MVCVDRIKDVLKNGELERVCVDWKWKIEVISVDNDLREMVIIYIIFVVFKFFMLRG